ncbi:hypothetical protein GCM10023160_31740 [Brachybacterium paraconglomeratum]|uniref:hypothetical protein n=1 Tax=Brachybacterium paraconglomeratum TaxID=173362 RepID=UPI0031E76AC4
MQAPERNREATHEDVGWRWIGAGILLGTAALLLLGLLCVGPRLGIAAVLTLGALTGGMVVAGYLLARSQVS